MKKYILIPATFICITYSLSAQDTLYKENGDIQAVKVIEIQDNMVIYKPFANPDSLTFIILKDEVKKILYENGTMSVFPKTDTNDKNLVVNIDPRRTGFGTHLIAVNATDLIFGYLTLNYEYSEKSGSFSIKSPVSIGFTTNEYPFIGFRYLYMSGIDFNFYPAGRGKWSYYLGPALNFGWAEYVSNYVVTPNAYDRTMFYGIVFQNGLSFQPVKHIAISFDIGLGMRSFKKNVYWYDNYKSTYTDTSIAFRCGINIGYNF